MKKILVIGSKGFIGTSARLYYESAGYLTYGCDILSDVSDRNYYQVSNKKSCYSDILNLVSPDLCLNASGSARPYFSFKNPLNDYELNVVNVMKILDAIRISSPKTVFINLSSAAVYGTPSKLPVNENANLTPISPYGWHKKQSEILCNEYADLFGLKTCSMRVFSAYGVGLKKQLFWDLFQKTNEGNEIELLGSGDESRDFIYVEDLIHASEIISINGSFQGEVYNVATGVETTIRTAAETFINALDWHGEISFTGSKRKGDPVNWCADITKIKEMGFSSKFSLNIGLKTYCRWLRDLQQQ